MSTKTISVNPDFFKIGGKKKTKKKLSHSLRTNFNSLQKNVLKDKMINKIKEFKKKQKKKKVTNDDDKFKDNYTDAVEFMEDVIKKKTRKKRKKLKKRMQENIINNNSNNMNQINNQNNNQMNVMNNNVNNLIKNDPPYGILKNGTKPLYSKYRKSLKNNNTLPTELIQSTTSMQNNVSPIVKDTISFGNHKEENNNVLIFTDEHKFGKQQNINTKRKNKLENLKENFLINRINKDLKTKQKNKKEKFKVKNKKVIKRFKLGKNAKTRKVAVLIKNKKTRRLINKDCDYLKKKKLKQVKNVLVNNALIRVGTQAPEKLLRDMYLNRHLAGDVKNSGGKNAEEILMHNWNSESR